MIRRLRVSRSPATGARHCPCRVSLHFFDGRGATPFAGVARSSKMTRSSGPEFRSADGSRLHSGECAQSLDVLIPTRRVARLLRGTRSRNTPTGILPRGRLRDWHPISRDRRPALLYGQTAAWPSRRRQHQKDSRRSHMGSHTEHGEPRSTRPDFRPIGRGSTRVGKWNSSMSMAKFFFKNPSFECIVA